MKMGNIGSVVRVLLATAAVAFALSAQAYTANAKKDANGNGSFYVSTSGTESTGSYQKNDMSISKSKTSATAYFYAFPDFGCGFLGWTTSATPPTTKSGEDAKWSKSLGKSDTVTYYAHFSTGAEVKDVYLCAGDTVQLYWYNATQKAWTARVNSTFLTSTTETSGSYATYTRSTTQTSKAFNIKVTALTASGEKFDQLSVMDYEGNVYHYRIHVAAAREIIVGESASCVVNSFASKAWTGTDKSSGYLSVSVTPTTASTTATATITGSKVTAASKYVEVKNYASATATGALGATYNLYATVIERPTITYYAAVATEVADQDETKDWGIGWAYASRIKKENSGVYQTSRSQSMTHSAEVQPTETSATIDGFYIFAFPNHGYKFTGWSKNDPKGAIVSTDAFFDTSFSVTAKSTDVQHPTVDTYYAHFAKIDTACDITLAVGDSVKLSFLNAEKAYTWSFQAIWTNETALVKEQVLNLDTTNTETSAYLAYTRSHDVETPSNGFDLNIQAIARSGSDFDQLTLEDCKGNVYHYRIHVTDPRIVEKDKAISFDATSFAEQAWSVSNVNVAVASAQLSSSAATNAVTITSTGAKKGKMTFKVGNWAAGTKTGALGTDYTFSVNVIEPWPVDFCQGDSVVIYYHNPNPKTWYLLINGRRFEANEVGYGDRMHVTLTASNPDTDTEILGTTTDCIPDGKSDLVIVTDGENFYAYRMGVWPRRVIGIGESVSMTCTTVATHPWRVQVPDWANRYVDVAKELDINGGHSARVTLTGKEPKQDVTVYVANFKDDGTVNAQGAYYVLVTDVKGAPTRSAYVSQGVSVTWGENYEHATGTTAYAVDPAATNKISATVERDGSTGVKTTLSVANDATFGDKGLFTVTDGVGTNVVRYDVMAYVPMSLVVGQIAPGCLDGSTVPWVVWSSDPAKFDVTSVLYNKLYSGRVEAKVPGDFWLWATNASDTVSWYAMRAQVYDAARRGIGVAKGGTVTTPVKAATGLAAVWSVTRSSDKATVTLDSAEAVNQVQVTIQGGSEEGLCNVLVKNAYHQETLVVYVGAANGQQIVLGDAQTLNPGESPYLPAECSTQDWTASSTDESVVTVDDSGEAGERVRITGVVPGKAQVVVKTASQITVYEIEVAKGAHQLPPITVGVGYTVVTNLTDISADLEDATLHSTGDRMIAASSLSDDVLTVVGKQDGTTAIELSTETTIYTLPIIVHERNIVKKITVYVGARDSVTSYSYTFDRYLSHENTNPDRMHVTVDGNTVTLTPTPGGDGVAQVTVECFVDGLAESSTVTYGITIKDIGNGLTVQDFGKGYLAYKGASRVEEIGDDLVMVFGDTAKAGTLVIPEGYNAKVDILAVGGGGAGGSVATGFGRGGGGGGAGGFSFTEDKVMPGGLYGIVAGEGGLAVDGSITGKSERGGPGADSVITNAYGHLVVMGVGGGGGGAPAEGQYAGEDGGSGGGGSWIRTNGVEAVTWVPGRGGIGVDGQGCAGGTPIETNCGGGGGGAGGNGGNGQTRGVGRYSNITGTTVLYSLGGFGGRSDVATQAATGMGPGFGGDGGNGGPGGNGGNGEVVVRVKKLYKNVLVPVPTTNDLVTARFLWEEGTNCVPFNYIGRTFRSKSDSHPYDWEDVIDTVSGVTNVVCELGGEGDTNKLGVGYYTFYVTLKEGFAWEDGDDPYGNTKRMSYRWVVVEDWANIDAALEINKTVWWSDMSNATIRVSSNASPETSGGGTPRVLFLGTACSSHGLTDDTIYKSLNAITSVADLEYWIYRDETLNDEGHNIKKGTSIAKKSWVTTGVHHSMSSFYDRLYDELVTKGEKYDYIVFEMDGGRMVSDYGQSGHTKDMTKEVAVAAKLFEMYEKDSVIWITDGGMQSGMTDPFKEVQGVYWLPNSSYYSSNTMKEMSVDEFQGLIGLFSPAQYDPNASTLEQLSATNTTYKSKTWYGGTSIEAQADYMHPEEVVDMLKSKIKVKPFNLYYQDKIVSPAAGLTLRKVTIEVCTEGQGGKPSTEEEDWHAIRHWDATTGLYYDDDPYHLTGVQGSSMEVNLTNNLVTAVLSNISFQAWVRYDTNVLDADGKFCSSEDANYNPATGQYEKNPNDGQAYLAMIDELGVGIGGSGEAETELPWSYTAYPIVGSVQNGNIFIAGSHSSQMSCAKGRDITVYYRGNGGYRLAALTVDGNSVQVGTGYDNSYTFHNLSAAHTISAVYTPYYGTVETLSETNRYDGTAHVPTVILKGWDETYATQVRYSLTEDGEYYTEAEFRELYSTNREVTCVGDHTIYCRAYAWQPGYGATLTESGWVWVDTRVIEKGVVTIGPKPLAMTAVSFGLKGQEVPEVLDQWRGVTVSGLVAGDTVNTNGEYLTFSCPTYQKVDGQYPIYPEKVDGKTDYDIVGANYTLTLLPGVVSVEKGPMIIGGVHQFGGLDPENKMVDTGVDRIEKVYDGVATNLWLDISEPPKGDDRRVLFSYDERKTWTDTYEPGRFYEVGTNKVWYAVEQGEDYGSSIYFWVTNYNYVIINRRPITITAASATKRYDTVALTTNGYTITAGTLAEGDGLYKVEVTGSQTDVGTCANVADNADIRLINNALGDPAFRTADYEITYVDGTLTVTPGAIAIGDVTYIPGATVVYGETGVSDVEKTYDGLGTNITVNVTVPSSGYEIYYSTNSVKDAQIEWWPSMSFTNAGAYAVHFLVESENYAAVTNFAYVKIHPRAVTVTVQNNQMKLGGTQPDYTAVYTYTDTGAKVPDEISDDFVFTLSATNENIVVGTCDIVAQGDKVQGNYSFTCVPGVLTVTDKDFITYTAENLDVPYDGKGHSQAVTVDPSVKGNVTVEYALSTNGPWSATAPIITNATTGVAVHYRIHSDAGTYLDASGTYFVTIDPLPVTVTANPAEIFDRDPLPPLSAVVTGTFAEGEGAELISYALSVSSMAMGTNEVVVTGGALQGNYAVGYVNARFVVKDWSYPAGPEQEPIPVDREWIMQMLGTNDLRYATATNFYYSEGQNGVTNWVNYVLGLEPTNYQSVIYLDMTPDAFMVSNATFFVRGIQDRRAPPIGSLTNIVFELMQCDTPTGTYQRVMRDEEGVFPQQNVPIKFYRANTLFEFRKP